MVSTGQSEEVQQVTAGERPLVTLAIFSYNQEEFIVEAIEGALSQTYSPLEIIISDDCSTDRTFELIQEAMRGRHTIHTVRIRKNSCNIGVCAHVSEVFKIAQGRLIIMNGGDDVSLPSRVEEVYAAWVFNGHPGAIQSAWFDIDENGDEIGFERRRVLIPENGILKWDSDRFADQLNYHYYFNYVGAALSYDLKSVFEKFPDFCTQIFNEDAVFPFRACLGNGVFYLPKPLVKYRRHSKNLSNAHPTSNYSNNYDPGKLKLHRFKANLNDIEYLLDSGLLSGDAKFIRDFLAQRIAVLEILTNWRKISTFQKLVAFASILKIGNRKDILRVIKKFIINKASTSAESKNQYGSKSS